MMQSGLSRRPRILQVVSLFPQDPIGGAERTLLEIMARGDDQFDFLVAVSGPGPFSTAVAQLGISTVFIPLRPLPTGLGLFNLLDNGVFLAAGICDVVSLWKLIGTRKVDLVCTLTRGAHVYGSIAACLREVPLVFQLHDIPQRPVARQLYGALFRRCAAGGIAVSQAVANGFADVQNGRKRPIRISYNGIDIRGFRERLNRGPLTTGELGLQADNYPVITTIGRLSPYKGVDLFVRVAYLVRQQFPQAIFLIVGSASEGSSAYVARLERLVYGLNLDSCVKFLGYRNDIPGILARSDILVSASQFESFGLTILEGMVAGLPVVATRCGGPEEILTDGEDGFLVPVGDATAMADAILLLARNPDQAREMGKCGRRRACRDFSIERHANEVLDFYQEILIDHHRSSRL